MSGLTNVSLEDEVRILGRALKRTLRPDLGFAVLLFDFGPKGHVAYLSNADRESLAVVLEAMAVRLRAAS